ncbi:hypothetical protein [Caldilinea sp.]|uniref:hypothetical protein n=1 Tax=Caldilinea sp. TaxID=2293560 RepID=UPI0021DD84A5|nr:hypothetical protein [Caldilinea sp.]GIV67621.1 MAG: hypothetical protein KatS3mg048_0483 [Caldilinea sp.]
MSALFSAGVGLLKYVADPLTRLPEITFWLLGSLASITCDNLARTLLPGEIPLGIFTSLFGAVAFLGLMTLQQYRTKS